MRLLLILAVAVIAAPASAQCPNGNCPPARAVYALPPLPTPARMAYPQTVERQSLPPRQGRQRIVCDPIVEDVFVQPRISQRVTYLPPVYETAVCDVPVRAVRVAPVPVVTYRAAPVKVYAAEGAYTRAEYGAFGRLRRVETTGDPARVPRSTPGPVATFFGAR